MNIDNIPQAPNTTNFSSRILEEVVKSIQWRIDNPRDLEYFGHGHPNSIYWQGPFNIEVIAALTYKGYHIMPQHGVGVPANDWKDHISSIYNWAIFW